MTIITTRKKTPEELQNYLNNCARSRRFTDRKRKNNKYACRKNK